MLTSPMSGPCSGTGALFVFQIHAWPSPQASYGREDPQACVQDMRWMCVCACAYAYAYGHGPCINELMPVAGRGCRPPHHRRGLTLGR